MSDRKSSRARKSVDYSKFGGGDDFDDDFADSTPPVSKRPKLSNNKENKEKNPSKVSSKKEAKARKPLDRKTVEERIFERELQEALELSMSQSDPSQESADAPAQGSAGGPAQESAPAPVLTSEGEGLVEVEDDNVPPSPIVPSIDNPPILTKQKPTDDEIEVLETDIEELPSRKRASKTKRYIDSDSEPDEADSDFSPEDDEDSFREESDDDSDEDFNCDDSDSDFGSSKQKTAKKNSAKSKTSKKSVLKGKSPKPSTGVTKAAGNKAGRTTSVKKSSSVPTPVATSSPAARAPPAAGLTSRKSPNWKPPGTAGEKKTVTTNNLARSRPPINSTTTVRSPLGGVNIKSPSAGLRLGLSRNMKLKPLHPNLKVQH